MPGSTSSLSPSIRLSRCLGGGRRSRCGCRRDRAPRSGTQKRVGKAQGLDPGHQLRLLQMDHRLGELVDRADMVVMRMADEDVVDGIRADPQTPSAAAAARSIPGCRTSRPSHGRPPSSMKPVSISTLCLSLCASHKGEGDVDRRLIEGAEQAGSPSADYGSAHIRECRVSNPASALELWQACFPRSVSLSRAGQDCSGRPATIRIPP